MATYFISDLHFHHKNILIYEPDRMVVLAKYIAANNDINEVYNTLVSMYNCDEETRDKVLRMHDNMLIDY